jgi:hypothetical protein
MSLASRLEKLEKRKPKKIPLDDEGIVTWALAALFPPKPQTEEPVYLDGEPSPYLVFLKLVQSHELERESLRRGIPLPPEEPPAWEEWSRSHMNESQWDDPEIHRNQRPSRGSIAPY